MSDRDAVFLDALADERLKDIRHELFKPVAFGLQALIGLAEDDGVSEDEFEDELRAFWEWILEDGAIDKGLLEEELANLELVAAMLGWTDYSRQSDEVSAGKSSGCGIPCGFGYISPDKVCRINERLLDAFKRSSDALDQESIDIGCRIPSSALKKYEAVLGEKMKPVDIYIETSRIRHVENRHGHESGDQKPIGIEDIVYVPKIMGYPSSIKAVRKRSGGTRFIVTKRTREVTYTASIEYGKRKGRFHLVTMYAKFNQKESR